jgi:hypothetical protein
MSLDFTLKRVQPVEVFSSNITHNLTIMAEAAGIYQCLWRPEELGIKQAGELVGPLGVGLTKLVSDPEHFRQFDSPNGWGTYDNFVRFVQEVLRACIENPDAEVEVSR